MAEKKKSKTKASKKKSRKPVKAKPEAAKVESKPMVVKVSKINLIIAVAVIAIVAFGAFLMFGPGIDRGKGTSSASIEGGDTVEVSYVGTYTNGTVFDEGEFGFVVGSQQLIPCFEQAVIGMKAGETKDVSCPPDSAYGNYNTTKLQELPRVDVIDREIGTDLEALSQYTEDEIVEGAELTVLGVEWPMTVVSIDGNNITLRHEPVLNSLYIPMSGPAIMILQLDEQSITMRVELEVGDQLRLAEGIGTVTEVREETFIVDTNHPMAGKTLNFEITILNLTEYVETENEGGDEATVEEQEEAEEIIVTPVGETTNVFKGRAGAEICTEGGKPVVYEFYTTTCPHCTWVKDSFTEVMQEYIDEGKIVAYQWALDKNDDALTEEAETEVPDDAIAVYTDFNSRGSVPTFVFGCKYYRIGSGYERVDNGKELEKQEFRQLLDMIIEEAGGQ